MSSVCAFGNKFRLLFHFDITLLRSGIHVWISGNQFGNTCCNCFAEFARTLKGVAQANQITHRLTLRAKGKMLCFVFVVLMLPMGALIPAGRGKQPSQGGEQRISRSCKITAAVHAEVC